MHDWSQEDFDWDSLWHCCNWFPKQLKRWARFPLTSCKEKWGAMRLEFVGMTFKGFYGLLFPGRLQWNGGWPYVWIKPKEIGKVKLEGYYCSIWYLLNNWSQIIAYKTGLSWLFWKYQLFVFNLVTLRACSKWPHIIKEITADYEFQEWLYKWVKKKIGFQDHWK